MNDRGPNDLERTIERLKNRIEELETDREILKQDIDRLSEYKWKMNTRSLRFSNVSCDFNAAARLVILLPELDKRSLSFVKFYLQLSKLIAQFDNHNIRVTII